MRITPDSTKEVVFLGIAPSGGEPTRFGGTGFFVEFSQQELHFRYLVTAAHVARALTAAPGRAVVRLNTHDQQCEEIDISQSVWTYQADDNVDVAVTPLWFDDKKYQLSCYNTAGFQTYSPLRVMCGDVISIIGLFRLRVGTRRNLPIVHTGNIAALPDAEDPIPFEHGGIVFRSPSYLVEAQTLQGLSGSPVYLHRLVGIPVPGEEFTGNRMPKGIGSAKLLGLYQVAWDGRPGEILESDRDLKGNTRVPVGIGMVVPCERILEMIAHDEALKAGRAEALQRRRVGP